MNFTFDGDVAKEYGIPEAILFYNIAFWEKQNRLNQHNYFDGRYWTYNTLKTYAGLFYFVSEATIKRALKHLKDEGLILVGNFDEDKFSRTNYYTLSDRGMGVLQNCTTRLGQNDLIGEVNLNLSILNKNTDSTDKIITDKNIPLISPKEKIDLLFEEFWKAYPNRRKYDKKGCRRKYGKIEDIEKVHADIMAALEIHKRSKDWTKNNGEYIPAPSVYLNQERWKHTDTRSEVEMLADDMLAEGLDSFFGVKKSDT